MDDVIYTLKDSFEYANKGQMETAQFITLLPPTARYISDIAPVKSYLLRGITWAQKQSENDTEDSIESDTDSDKEDAEPISPGVIMSILDLTPDVDMAKLILHVNAMLINGLGKVDGEIKLTKPLSDNLSVTDTYGLVGCFIINFIMPSL